MNVEQVKYTFNGMESSDALRTYAEDKLTKFPNLLNNALSIDVVFTENKHQRGVSNDFLITIGVKVPQSFIRVEERGPNMYELIDKSTDVLNKRFVRYHKKIRQWEGHDKWDFITEDIVEEEVEVIDEDNEFKYIPKISHRRKMSEMRPLEEPEAIEYMELLGYKQLLFKNKNTGKYSMIYRDNKIGYVLVEPEDDLVV